MLAAEGPLTRSRIEAFDQTANALSDAANRWRAGAERMQQAADSYVEQISAPNGSEWRGQTAKSAFETAHADRLVVSSAIDHADVMADVAERGAGYLRGARGQALDAITRAENEDFSVAEDLSVSDNYSWNSASARIFRQQAAVAHRNYIAHTAGRLAAENARVAAQLHAGAAQMAGMTPAHWRQPLTALGEPSSLDSRGDKHADTSASKRQGKVQAVDNHTWKQDPVPNPGGITRAQAAAALKDVNRRIAEHNAQIPEISALPPNDPRRRDFSIDTGLLNEEKKQYLAVLPPQTVRPPTVITRDGAVLPGVPPGLISELPTNSGQGWIYRIVPNQPGIDPRAVYIRVMEPTSNYPNGYVNYLNIELQEVDPFTGRTVPPDNRYAHIELPK